MARNRRKALEYWKYHAARLVHNDENYVDKIKAATTPLLAPIPLMPCFAGVPLTKPLPDSSFECTISPSLANLIA